MNKRELRQLKREAQKQGIEVHYHGLGLDGLDNMIKWHKGQGLDEDAAFWQSVTSDFMQGGRASDLNQN